MTSHLFAPPQHPLPQNAVVLLDPFASETPYHLRGSDVYGLVQEQRPYASGSVVFFSYTLGTIEEVPYFEGGGYRLRPCGEAYDVPAHTIILVKGIWNPVTQHICQGDPQ